MLNSARTLARFWLSKLERRTGLSLLPARVEAISNYHRIDDRLATGGQPNAAQIAAIAKAGYGTVVNLAPATASNALPGERDKVEATGMAYVHIPVAWIDPKETDFEQFCATMRDRQDDRIFVHCAANMRVSAFVYRYRRDVLGVDETKAAADLRHLWQPTGVWAEFIRPGGRSA